MSRVAFEFLRKSPLWSSKDRAEGFAGLTDDELKAELSRYRAHVLDAKHAKAVGLGVAISARQGLRATDTSIKRSVLYFDEVLLPDPVFDVSEWSRDRLVMPWMQNDDPRLQLAAATRYMESLAPLVELGRIRFIPSTHVLEPPLRPLVYIPEEHKSGVPKELLDWFTHRADVRKVVTDELGRRLVLRSAPDDQTGSIQIDFGQLGRVAAYDYQRIVGVTDDKLILGMSGPPADPASLNAWLTQSISSSASDLLDDVLADLGVAQDLGCSFVTSCTMTAELLDVLHARQLHRDGVAESALSLNLPILETASIEQLAELIEREPAAFEAFRYELRIASESLSMIDEPRARAEEGLKTAQKLAREQVHEVDRKLREAKRGLKWDVPITIAQLAAGAIGLLSGDLSGLILASGLLTGGATGAGAVKKYAEHRALPGYFLWKLKSSDA